MEITHGVGYLATVSGLLKLIEIIFAFLSILLITINGWRVDYFEAFVIGLTICMFLSLVMIICGLTVKFETLLNYQSIVHACLFIYTLVVSSVCLSKNYLNKTQEAGGAFGLITSLVYLGDAVHSYLQYRPFF
ncbi:unnamed protein product [Brassicogethes aeneus]|uniref:MARVEL domain-containing protein n=1 Tax=Brassicogethes aeneus TaxID=1431903 RepID=A0A9P0BA60_BRAAE|nr:unnamed protein product [Brassicogethes aeneus]